MPDPRGHRPVGLPLCVFGAPVAASGAAEGGHVTRMTKFLGIRGLKPRPMDGFAAQSAVMPASLTTFAHSAASRPLPMQSAIG
jgi:hypothetical protein